MIPQPNNPGVRLDELNKIIRDLDTGSDAAGKLAELDANAGLADPQKKAKGIASGSRSNWQYWCAKLTKLLRKILCNKQSKCAAQMATLEAEAARLMEEAQES